MRRYVCPQCKAGKIAPDRLDPEDARGFCLDCSKTTGRLVRRVWAGQQAAQERAEKTAAARRESALKRRERERAQAAEREREQFIVAGLDAREVLHQIVMTRTIQTAFVNPRCRGVRKARKLELVIRRRPAPTPRRTVGEGYSGHCHGWRIVLTVPGDVDAAGLRWLLAHEACHLPAVPRDRGGRRETHGPEFRGRLRRVVEELWGVVVPDPGGPVHTLDMAILKALRQAAGDGAWNARCGRCNVERAMHDGGARARYAEACHVFQEPE